MTNGDPRVPPAVRARHEAIYSRGLVPDFVHWKVTPRLFAGRNPLSEQDVLELAALGVTHVLDLRQDEEWSGPAHERPGSVHGKDAVEAMARHGLERKSVPIPDFAPPRLADFAAAVAWLEEVLARGRTHVYVHCRAGIERSGTILAAWLAWQEGLDVDRAVVHLRKHGWPAAPLREQRQAAATYLADRRLATAGTPTGRLPPPPEKTPADLWREIQPQLRRQKAWKERGGETADEAKARLAATAKPCPTCGTRAEELHWFWHTSAPDTFARLEGKAGWATACRGCRGVVELLEVGSS